MNWLWFDGWDVAQQVSCNWHYMDNGVGVTKGNGKGRYCERGTEKGTSTAPRRKLGAPLGHLQQFKFLKTLSVPDITADN